jgi:hypothetical protein
MPCPDRLPLGTLVRTERSVSCFSRGAEVVQAIHNLADGKQHPHAEWVCQEFDLTPSEWHYWRRLAESPRP